MTDSIDSTHERQNEPGDNQEMIPSSTENSITQTNGTVKWFDPRKGFGFIVGPEEQDIFVHFTVIEGDGFRVLKDGVTVCYDAEKNDKGWRATKIHSANVEAQSDDEDAPEVVVPRRTYSRTPRQ